MRGNGVRAEEKERDGGNDEGKEHRRRLNGQSGHCTQ